jgi:hypothetical protein
MQFIAQAIFVIAASPTAGVDPLPSFEYLRALLGRTDADHWLVEQGVELPADFV